ncbi:MAG: inorganic phosphate transporter [Verrucomicrobia bacterium]|nr:inorganic phosphate transporter [Verrucomicrobiota bacterium]
MGLEIVVLIVILGLLFDYTNGFHDAANVVATPIATKIVTPLVAIILASIFNFIGATQISGVAQTITTGLVQAHDATQSMVLAAVVGAIFWNFLTWYFGIPSSSSYALVGGLIGAALVQGGAETVIWKNIVFKVIIPMVFSPIVGFFLAYLVMRLLLKTKDKRIFRYLQMISAGFLALSHGLNDAQKSMGIITLGLLAAGMIPTPHIPLWVIGSCAVMMALGTATGGFRIIKTMAFEITELKPIQGFAAEASASVVILLASFLGMPISSTHMIAGSITGVGSARGAKAVQWSTAKKLVWAWVLTLPGAALASASVFKIFLNILS